MAKKTKGEPIVTAGTLKLSPKDTQKFQAAIEAYAFERPATFLRLCAQMIIRHHEAGDQLAWPMRLRLARLIDDSGDSKNKQIVLLSEQRKAKNQNNQRRTRVK